MIGGGANGLAAAIALARAGRSVVVHEAQETLGGGARTAELTLPGFHHDVCSAIHPLGTASPAWADLPLAAHGLEWIHPEVPLAHPLDDGTAVLLHRSIDEAANEVDPADRPSYRGLMQPFVERWADLADGVLRPLIRIPRHPLLMARFGVLGVQPARFLARRTFERRRARALFAGLAAHSLLSLDAPLSASFGLVLGVAAHAVGWPMPRGGSQSITDALAAHLRSLGGTIVPGHPVRTLADAGEARAFLFDTSPRALARIAGTRLPDPFRRSLESYPAGPGVFKIDYALAGPMPWRARECLRAGTVHVGGTLDDIARSEAAVAAGRHPERPFVLVTQQSLFDPTRAPAGKHTLWAYCHVPTGSAADMTGAIEAQLERFAPGFRDLVLARATRGPAAIEAHNENFVGGDISGGPNGLPWLFTRPSVRSLRDPYATPDPALTLCSAATPPGGGIHGMCGLHAARSALRRSFS